MRLGSPDRNLLRNTVGVVSWCVRLTGMLAF
jgi:hypothetical protein